MSKKTLILIVAAVAVVGAGVAWWMLSKPKLPPGFAGGNGRLEAQQVDVAAKYAGRLKTVLPHEGDTVDAGQVVATIDTEPLESQLRASQAQIVEAQNNLRSARASNSGWARRFSSWPLRPMVTTWGCSTIRSWSGISPRLRRSTKSC